MQKECKSFSEYDKVEANFWKKKIEEYIQNIQKAENKAFSIQKIMNWNLSKKLSQNITISVICKEDGDEEYYNFIFNSSKKFKVCYSDSAQKIIYLFNLVFQNFEKDSSELQALIIPIMEHENAKIAEQDEMRLFAENLMNDSDYEWKLKGNVLQIKLKSMRIIEFVLSRQAINHFWKNNNYTNLLESIKQIDKHLCKNPFPINIKNSLIDWKS